MKSIDSFRIVGMELKNEWKESALICGLQIMVLSGVILVLTLSFGMDHICNEYLKRSGGEYTFILSGYKETDKVELEKMGFKNIEITDGKATAVLTDFEHIWIKKIKSILCGKDIWNGEIDEMLSASGVFEVIFFVIACLLVGLLLSVLQNSLTMKLLHRRKFIKLMYQLGCEKKILYYIYHMFVITRMFFSFIVVWCLCDKMCEIINRHIWELLGIKEAIVMLSAKDMIITFFTFVVLISIRNHKVWREKIEFF